MRFAIRLLHAATLLLALLGLWGLVRSGAFEGDDLSARLTAMATARPWIWAALLGWWLTELRARALVRGSGPFRAPDEGPAYTPAAAAEPDPAAGAGRSEPIPTARGDHDPRGERLRKLRLGALLKGRHPDVPGFVDALLVDAVESGAGDVHLHPGDGEGRVTVRRRGERREIARYPASLHPDLVRRIKVLADMRSYQSDRPQDGRFRVDTPSGPAEIRVSVVPSGHGETVALRLAGRARSLELDALGFEPEDLARVESLLREPQGLLVLTGPTGSGKTTTLYSALGHIHRERGTTTHLASIEDPVEVELPFVQQTRVDRARKLDFAAALRSLLRQDPDVLMVGEIRDAETAKVAVQAGLSGHLILTTLHAESTVGVFPRLIDLGVEPFLAGSAVAGVISQRLARTLCEHCRHPRSLDRKQRARLGELGLSGEGTFHTAEGCSRCDGSGFAGRRAVFEVLVMDAELRKAVAAKASVDQLREQSGGGLLEAGLRSARRGEIPLSEVLPWAGAAR